MFAKRLVHTHILSLLTQLTLLGLIFASAHAAAVSCPRGCKMQEPLSIKAGVHLPESSILGWCSKKIGKKHRRSMHYKLCEHQLVWTWEGKEDDTVVEWAGSTVTYDDSLFAKHYKLDAVKLRDSVYFPFEEVDKEEHRFLKYQLFGKSRPQHARRKPTRPRRGSLSLNEKRVFEPSIKPTHVLTEAGVILINNLKPEYRGPDIKPEYREKCSRWQYGTYKHMCDTDAYNCKTKKTNAVNPARGPVRVTAAKYTDMKTIVPPIKVR